MADISILAGLFILAIFAFLALIVWAIVFWILMVIDCTKRKFRNDTDKIVWILVIIFAQLIGALIYYFVIKKK